jgi:hypothetical protein
MKKLIATPLSGFDFTDIEGYFDPHCDFCGKPYESIGVQIRFSCSYEICYSCILKGPKAVAAETTRRPAREFHDMIRRWFMQVKAFANKFKAMDSFRDLPGGILAVKVAEAYRETETDPRARKGAA